MFQFETPVLKDDCDLTKYIISRGINSTAQTKRSKPLEHLPEDESWAMGSTLMFSDDIGYPKRDDHLQFTRWTWL